MNAATDRERRKQVRLGLRRDLIVVPQRYQGRTHYIVKDPIGLQYYRFQEREHFLIQLLDGARTLADVQQEYEKRFRPARLSLEEVEAFAQQLVIAGLVQGCSPDLGEQLLDRGRRSRRGRRLAALANCLAIQVPLFDPDRFLGRLLPWLRWLFTPAAFVISGGLVLAALLLVAVHFEVFRARLPAYHEFFRFHTVVYLWLALGLVKVLHELGHGLCCKAFGRDVHEMGVMILCLTPCLYCNVSDAWLLPSKWQRMAISFAGIYVELILASLAGFVWWHSTNGTFLNQLCLNLMLVCSINTVIFNGNPLMRFDGYYLLADWLEVPNLRECCNRLVTRLALVHGLGIDVVAGPRLGLGRRLLFVGYAVASYLYRWAMTFSVLWFLSLFLKPYRLGAISGLLAVATLVPFAGGPVYRLGRFLVRRGGRLPSMKLRHVLGSGGVIVAGLLVFFVVPLPVSRVRQVGLVHLPPEAVEAVFVQTPGTLQRLHVREGEWVEKGDLLAEFRSLDLEDRRAEALVEHDIYAVQVESLNACLAATTNLQQRARLEMSRAKLTGERMRSARRVALQDQLVQRLQLRAPRAGVVMGLPPVDDLGKYWERDQPAPFCRIGDPGRPWVLVPLGPADFRLLQEDLDSLTVTVCLPGRGGRTWAGRVVQLPAAAATDIPLPLTQRYGGPVATKPGGQPNSSVAQSPHYLVAIALLDPDGAVLPGMRAHVAIHCRWRTCAWWVWHGLAAAFDLGAV